MTILGHLFTIQCLLIIGLVASAAYYLGMLYSAWEFFRSWRDPEPSTELPPITVLKPLKGLDPGLLGNLSTLCEQDYDRFQLVFGVADDDDPAVGVVRELQAAFPHVDISLVVDSRVYGSNYKVSNLHNMYRHAKHDLIVLADSDIRVQHDHLRRLASELRDPRIGLVTCLYRAVATGALTSRLEALFVNTDFCGMVLVARKVERPRYAFGATIAMRRAVLDEIGGFLPIANHLADDYELGHRVAERGYVLALSSQVVETVTSIGTWRHLFRHQLRWARTNRVCRPGGYFGSFLTHGTFWACATLLYGRAGSLSWLAAAAVLALRNLAAARLTSSHLHAPMRRTDWLLLPVKDLLISGIWVLSFLGNTVWWSGRRFRVLANGEMTDLTPNAPPGGVWQPDTLPPLPESTPSSPQNT